jgi:hypothetical protein
MWMWGPQEGNNVGPELFDNLYQRFKQDFGTSLYVVPDEGWNCAITGWGNHLPIQDCTRPIHHDVRYVWGAAQNGYSPVGEVAVVGPGYDERGIPGRGGVYRPRDGGRWYTTNFQKAIASRKPLLAIETWNEFHEGSNICESREYGRLYIDLTRNLVAQYKLALAVHA